MTIPFELIVASLIKPLGGAISGHDPNDSSSDENQISTWCWNWEEAAYISYETIKGAGGLPVGTSGKACSCLVGIDSPVAGYLAWSVSRYRVSNHFAKHLIPAQELLKSPWFNTWSWPSLKGILSEVPFTEIQEEIKAKAPEAYPTETLICRFMMRITDRILEVRAVVWSLLMVKAWDKWHKPREYAGHQCRDQYAGTRTLKSSILPKRLIPWNLYPVIWRLL